MASSLPRCLFTIERSRGSRRPAVQRLHGPSRRSSAIQQAQGSCPCRARALGVENDNHRTFDVAFEEDDRPWIEGDANGMLAVLVLR